MYSAQSTIFIARERLRVCSHFDRKVGQRFLLKALDNRQLIEAHTYNMKPITAISITIETSTRSSGIFIDYGVGRGFPVSLMIDKRETFL